MSEVKPATKAQLLSVLAVHESTIAKQTRKLNKLQKETGKYIDYIAEQDRILKQMKEFIEQQMVALNSKNADLITLRAECTSLKIEIENLNKIIQQISANQDEDSLPGARDIRAQKRSHTQDSIALIVDQGREPVNTTVTTIRSKLRSPARTRQS